MKINNRSRTVSFYPEHDVSLQTTLSCVFCPVFAEQVGLDGETVAPSRRLEELIHLAELCVDLLQQNEDHYAEVKCCIKPCSSCSVCALV